MVPAAAPDASEATSTTSVPRVVGDPLEGWVVVASGLVLLAVIVLAGVLARSRTRSADRA